MLVQLRIQPLDDPLVVFQEVRGFIKLLVGLLEVLLGLLALVLLPVGSGNS